MKDIKNLGEIFEIEDNQNTVKLKLKTQDNFEGVGRLTGREQMILMFKANNEYDLKSYIYLKDGSVIFADCDSKLSDIHKWQLPAIVSFLQEQNIDLGPTHIFDKLAPVSNKQKKQDAPKKSSAFIQGGTDWLAQNIQGLTQEAPIDPKFAPERQRLFFDVVKAALQNNIVEQTVIDANYDYLEKESISIYDKNNLEYKIRIVRYLQGKTHPRDMVSFRIAITPERSLTAGAISALSNYHAVVGAKSSDIELEVDETNITKEIHDAVIELLYQKPTFDFSDTGVNTKTDYLSEAIKDFSQDSAEQEELVTHRGSFSRLEEKDGSDKQRFSQILVLVSQLQQRGRITFTPALVLNSDGVNLTINNITVKEGAYDLVLNLEYPLPFTNQYSISISDKNCSKALTEQLSAALEKMITSKQ